MLNLCISYIGVYVEYTSDLCFPYWGPDVYNLPEFGWQHPWNLLNSAAKVSTLKLSERVNDLIVLPA